MNASICKIENNWRSRPWAAVSVRMTDLLRVDLPSCTCESFTFAAFEAALIKLLLNFAEDRQNCNWFNSECMGAAILDVQANCKMWTRPWQWTFRPMVSFGPISPCPVMPCPALTGLLWIFFRADTSCTGRIGPQWVVGSPDCSQGKL